MKDQFIHYFRLLISRAVVVYAGCFLLLCPFLNATQLKDNAIQQTMSRFVPPIDYHKEFVVPVAYDPYKLHLCLSYHQRVAVYFPVQKAEALAVVGYCNELMGRRDKAVASYRDSLKVNPYYFWSHFNLGALEFKKGDYVKAGESLQNALQSDPKVQMLLLSRSKIYTDIRLSSLEFQSYNFFGAIEQGRLDAYVMMMESLARLERFKELFQMASLGIKEKLGEEDIFYYYAGRAALSLKAYEQALTFLETAVQKNPFNTEALYYLGLCMRAAKKEDLAEKLLAKAKEISAQQPSAIEKHLNTKPRLF